MFNNNEENDDDDMKPDSFLRNNKSKEPEEKEELVSLRLGIRPNSPCNRDEMNSVRGAMAKVGSYGGVSPGFYERSTMDKPLEASIRNYQKEKGLEVDAVLKPKGETEKKINEDLSALKQSSQKVEKQEKSNFKDNLVTTGRFIGSGLISTLRPNLTQAEKMGVRSVEGIIRDGVDMYDHYKRLNGLKKDDGEKHRELSCRGGQKGDAFAIGTLVGGGVKEVIDLNKKLKDDKAIEKHGGKKGVLADSWKDMKNNIKGVWHGFLDKTDDCEVWAKRKK